MLASKEFKYVFVAIPKTGTLSVREWLKTHYQATQIAEYHDWRVPECYRGFTVFTVVRNPYERCFSDWWYNTRDPGRRNKSGDRWGLSFGEYMRRCIYYRDHGCAWHETPEAYMTQSRYVKKSGASYLVHLEALQSEIRKLPFVCLSPPIPHLRRTNGKPQMSFAQYFSAKEEELVWEYCAEDFAAFGYERLKCLKTARMLACPEVAR